MPQNELQEQTERRLGKLPARSSPKQLHFAKFVKAAVAEPPPAVTFWDKRVKFPARTYGNTKHGCCTIASQAVAATRMERIEQRRTIEISTDEVLRVYYAMTDREYGGGDTGAYEVDALDNWRRPELTFRDSKGRPHTIDAYLKVNHTDIAEIKRAIAFSGVHGVKICFNLPAAWSVVDIPQPWDLPEGQMLTGPWMPGSWGGHSMFAGAGYNKLVLPPVHTWYNGGLEVNYGIQQATWRAIMAYCDECYIVVDSVNAWKRQGLLTSREASKLVSLVNAVSSQKIAA